MAAVDISLFNFGHLDQSHSSFRVPHGHSRTHPPIMALEPRASHYPLFIEPQREYYEEPITQDDHEQISSDSNPTRSIVNRIRTTKLDTPALRRAQTALQLPGRSPSLARRTPRAAYTRDAAAGEPSAFALTSSLVHSHQDGTASKPARNNGHARNQSIQQRRAHGGLTLTSPTARQARGRPACPMIWLPDEQVWLLADSEAVTGTAAASSGVAYPNSAPLREAARAGARRRESRDRRQESERSRLHRSDSSPIRTQSLRLMDNTSFAAQDWTHPRAATGPSAVEEDAIWHAEQQARARSRRDQDRFSPMLQQALVGVDLPVDSGAGPAEYLAVPGEQDLWVSHAMRRSSTTGDLDNIANILAAAEYRAGAGHGQRRTIAQRRSGSLRSRVSTVGNDDYDAQAASLHIRDLKEGGQQHQRRHSADEVDTPRSEYDGYEHEWLASLIAQGTVPDGIFTPRGSVVDEPGTRARTPRGSERVALGRLATDENSPARSAISPIAGGLSRSATMANDGRLSRVRYISVSTTAGDERRASVDTRDGGDVSPVSSRGRDSLYE